MIPCYVKLKAQKVNSIGTVNSRWCIAGLRGLIILYRYWFFPWETIIRSEVATEWDTCQLFASVCAKLEVGISPHSLCGSLSANVYLQRSSHLTMEEEVQQSLCIDFCFCLGKTGAETYEMLQAAFGESCLSRWKTFEWYSHFKSGRWSFEDDPHPGRLSTSHIEETVARVREIIHADQRLTIWVVAEEVRTAFVTCQKILTEDLQKRCVMAKFVPCLLTAEQKDDRVSTELCDRALKYPTPSLFPWPCSVPLLLVPATEENNEKLPIRLHWRNSN
jgi:hypothetical protein